MKNEKTSKRVAAIAARIMQTKPQFDYARDLDGNRVSGTMFCMFSKSEWADIRALAASALTQAPDKPKPKPRAKVDRCPRCRGRNGHHHMDCARMMPNGGLK